MTLQDWANRAWYERRVPHPLLVPLAALFWAVSALRRACYRRGIFKSVALAAPVIVVGNITVGGTGKTPLTCWLARELATRGSQPGIVTRGFGGSETAPQLIDAQADPLVHGDEPVMMARRTGLPVAVGRDRPAAAQLLLDVGCDVIVSDDGMQHYALRRDCEIAVIDGKRFCGNGWLLPAGPLRETSARLDQVDAIVINGASGKRPDAIYMKLEGSHAIRIQTDERRNLSEFAGATVHALAAIGHPDRFFNMLRAYGIQVIGHAYDDHQELKAAHTTFDDNLAVLMTEKDAVKCTRFADARHWFVPVDVVFAPSDADRLLRVVRSAVDSSPRQEHHG